MAHVRHSIHDLQRLWESGEDKSKLENLVKAFRGIQKIPAGERYSFFTIAGYHGLPKPFYCHHGQVLFPLWHRAYLLRLEDALRSIPGCESVTMPYWDETRYKLIGRDEGSPDPIPSVLTSKYFPPGSNEPNPLYSYTLAGPLDKSKPQGYTTVRYPLAGDAADDQQRKASAAHNNMYKDEAKNTELLNGLLLDFLETPSQQKSDTNGVFNQFNICLDAPNYTSFSNVTSAGEWQGQNRKGRTVSIEKPHNHIHVAFGGYAAAPWKPKDEPIKGASGDMGFNDFAAFDPIFYLHHCFIDLVFWLWQQKHNVTQRGQLTIIPGFPGTTNLDSRLGELPLRTPLTMDTPLNPFGKPGSKTDAPPHVTGHDLTDIKNDLNYDYARSSLHPPDAEAGGNEAYLGPEDLAQIVCYKRVRGLNINDYRGSVIVRLMAKGPNGKTDVVDSEAILSRIDSKADCDNCQDQQVLNFIFPVTKYLIQSLGSNPDGDYSNINFWIEVQDADNVTRRETEAGRAEPEIEHLDIPRD